MMPHIESQAQRDALTQEKIKEILHYDPINGVFTWVNSFGTKCAGSVAGSVNCDGYTIISINGKTYAAGRLAHLYMTGRFPIEIDHKNRNRSDDRWCNIREASRSQNGCNKNIQRNNTSGVKCVSWDNKKRSWLVQININKKKKHIGRFYDLELAELVANEARDKFYGEFA